jgi:hypothetical protein
MAVFEIRRYKSKSDNEDLYIGDPHKVGSENPNNLSRYVLVERWPWLRVSFLLTRSLSVSESSL